MHSFLMSTVTALSLIAVGAYSNFETTGVAAGSSNAPQYTADGKMLFPANYREWVFFHLDWG
jgi:hypothetical protein